MLNSNLNLSTLPESTFTYQFVNSALLFPCMEYQRLLRTEKVAIHCGKLLGVHCE